MATEYTKLTKVQKIAAFLITIGPDNAGKMVKSFENAELEQICREIAVMPVLEAPVQREVIREFAGIVSNSLASSLGGVPFAQLMLGHAKGEHAAATFLNRCAVTTRSEAGDELRQMESSQLKNLTKTEHPQTIAFILSCMDAKKAADLVATLPDEVRDEVVERLGSMDSTSHESLARVVKNITSNVDTKAPAQSVRQAGGAKACAEVLNALNKDIRKALISRIEERNAPLGAAIRKEVFSFEDLIRLSPADLQRVLREVDSASLPVALKGVKPELIAAVLGAMSKRAAQAVKDEVDQLGPQKLKDVEAAQAGVIAIVRKLEESEEITLEEGGGDSATV